MLSCSQPLAEAHTRITTGSAVELPDYFLRISDDVNMTALDFPRLSTAACGAQRRRSWPAKARLFLRSWDNRWDCTRVLRFARGVHQGRTEACQRVDRRRQTLSLVTRKAFRFSSFVKILITRVRVVSTAVVISSIRSVDFRSLRLRLRPSPLQRSFVPNKHKQSHTHDGRMGGICVYTMDEYR